MIGTAILTDFDKTMYTINPAKKQAIAVLVPEANIPHNTAQPTRIKKMRSFVNLDVSPNRIKATDEAPALHP